MRNRQMIVRWLMANTKAIEQRTRDNKTYLVMTDPKAFREGVGKLLAEVQRIKSEGDYAAAKAAFETHGIHFDASLRDEIVKRVDSLRLPSHRLCDAKLTTVTGSDGNHRRADFLSNGPHEADAGCRRFEVKRLLHAPSAAGPIVSPFKGCRSGTARFGPSV